MDTLDNPLATLTDWELGETIHNRHAALMLLEVNGGQYSTERGLRQISEANARYADATAERRRRAA